MLLTTVIPGNYQFGRTPRPTQFFSSPRVKRLCGKAILPAIEVPTGLPPRTTNTTLEGMARREVSAKLEMRLVLGSGTRLAADSGKPGRDHPTRGGDGRDHPIRGGDGRDHPTRGGDGREMVIATGVTGVTELPTRHRSGIRAGRRTRITRGGSGSAKVRPEAEVPDRGRGARGEGTKGRQRNHKLRSSGAGRCRRKRTPLRS